jgi:hypothetical protein
MKTAMQLIQQGCDDLVKHPFFARLKPRSDMKAMMSFAPAATFWVMSFQDILRFNADMTKDASIKRIVGAHLVEDSGHEEWFLQDLADVFGSISLSAKGTFAAEHRDVRQVAFALASEVYRINDDRLRLVYLEVLEGAAKIYFNRISAALVAAGHKGKLRYFGGEHLNAEASHEMHQDDHHHEVESIELPPALRDEANAMIQRMFAQFHRLGDALVVHMNE